MTGRRSGATSGTRGRAGRRRRIVWQQPSLSQQQQAFFAVAGDEHQAPGGVQRQAFDHRQPSLLASRQQAADRVGAEPSKRDRGQADQAERDGQGEDRAEELGEIHVRPCVGGAGEIARLANGLPTGS